ncbi:magnesium transporter [Paratractidigestivibacter sp.]|uniref:magnesium transporter n=1 Tax=Paratractidigestivibacter sp. TaxID=2847316 RepID=UPI002ACB115A|nr:CBS domain-containing protein [Paratractidigestivibacter sp.]
MIYLSQLMGNPVYAADGEKIGTVSDLGIATGEVFPRVTALAFKGPGRTPFMISWRKYVDSYDESEIRLKVNSTDIRFSYLQPDEVLIARDILNKQIVDTRGMRVVRVNDLKLSDTNSTQLRLLGAEVGARGILRSLHPALERGVMRVARALGKQIPERIIAWSYMDLVERDLSNVKLSVSHKTLDDMHPADIADIIERLDPRLRGQVFAQLDDEQRAGAMAEFDDDAMAAELMGNMNETDASRMLSEMDPDDAAELVSELDYDKAEKLLRLMGVQEQRAVRQLLGYREDTAGRIMTSEFASMPEEGTTVADAVQMLRGLDEDFEAVRYVYLIDEDNKLSGVVTLNQLIVSEPETRLKDVCTEELITASPEDDQEDVAENIAKYNLLAMPVVADDGHMLGIVTVDDALDVLEEEHAEDLQIAGGAPSDDDSSHGGDLVWMLRRNAWFFLWFAGVVVLAALAPRVLGENSLMMFLTCAALPAALVLSDDALSYVANFFLQNDPNDDGSPSAFGFAVKSIGLGIVLAGVVFLASLALRSVRFAEPLHAYMPGLALGLAAASVAVLLTFVACPIYLAILRTREEKNLDTSGFTMSLTAMVVALAVFVAAVALLAPTMLGA